MVRYWIKDYKYTTVTGEVIIEPDVYVIKDEDLLSNMSFTDCFQVFTDWREDTMSSLKKRSILVVNCTFLRKKNNYKGYNWGFMDLPIGGVEVTIFIEKTGDNIQKIIDTFFVTDYLNNGWSKYPLYINGVKIESQTSYSDYIITSYSDYKISLLEAKLAKLMTYLSIPTCVIEDDPVEEEDDSSLSEVDKLIKENAKLKKMLGLA
jgi:hypothetical protein